MIGHEALHDAIFMRHTPWLNRIIAFITLDCMLVSTHRWIVYHHKEHHSYPNSSVDTQRLEGETFVSEFWHSLKLLFKYLTVDVVDVVLLKAEPQMYIALPIVCVQQQQQQQQQHRRRLNHRCP
jgi:fatty acid desaturase